MGSPLSPAVHDNFIGLLAKIFEYFALYVELSRELFVILVNLNIYRQEVITQANKQKLFM